MQAMRLHADAHAVVADDIAAPTPQAHELLLQVRACGVCRTDLHIVDAELPVTRRPLTPGHEIIGTVVATGPDCHRFAVGARVGVPWLGFTCGTCQFCATSRENLCDRAEFTGYHRDGGYADFVAADERYCFAIPDCYSDAEAAPLLCAGLIGYRSLRAAGDAKHLGIYGFGAAAHIVAQVARFEDREIYAFTPPGDKASQAFAHAVGAVWAGDSGRPAPVSLDAAIIFAPVGSLVVTALQATRKGGTVVCAGIHMTDIPSFRYQDLWGERVVRSIANLTRRDGDEFLELAPRANVRTTIEPYPLNDANRALDDLRGGRINGAAVLVT